MKKKVRKILLKSQTKIGDYIFLIFFGFILIFIREDVLPRRGIGFGLILISILLLCREISIHKATRKSKKSYNILIPEHKIIAKYLENNNIKYIYEPEDEKRFEFYLPDYDIYVKYWGEYTTKVDRERLEKKINRLDLKYIEIYYDKIDSMKTLHGSFMKKLSQQTKIR